MELKEVYSSFDIIASRYPDFFLAPSSAIKWLY
jgi:hypothetical protein